MLDLIAQARACQLKTQKRFLLAGSQNLVCDKRSNESSFRFTRETITIQPPLQVEAEQVSHVYTIPLLKLEQSIQDDPQSKVRPVLRPSRTGDGSNSKVSVIYLFIYLFFGDFRHLIISRCSFLYIWFKISFLGFYFLSFR